MVPRPPSKPPEETESMWSCDVCAFQCAESELHCPKCWCERPQDGQGVDGKGVIPPPKSTSPAGGGEKTKEEKRREKREKLLAEVVSTERAYVQSLSVLNDVLTAPLLEGSRDAARGIESFATIPRVRVFFSHTHRIYKVNRRFLRELQQALAAGGGGGVGMGATFVEFAPLFRIYGNYAESHERVSKLLRDAVEKDPEAKEWVARLSVRSERWRKHVPQGSPFFLFIKPVQRVPRYRMLLEELVRYTPEGHPSLAELKSALKLIKTIATSVNETIRQAENREKMHSLQMTWANPDEVDLLEGKAGERRLVKEGVMQRHTRRTKKRFHFHLFNDLLLYSEEAVISKMIGTQFKLHFRSILNACAVKDQPRSPTDEGFLFSIQLPKKSFIVECETNAEKLAWMQAFRGVIADLPGHKLGSSGTAVAPVWAKDDTNTSCGLCDSTFNFLVRRHHCRACGSLVCGRCSTRRIILANISKVKKQRVCDECNDKHWSTARSAGGRSNSRLSRAQLSTLESDDEDEEKELKRPAVDTDRWLAVKRCFEQQREFCSVLSRFVEVLIGPFLSRVHMNSKGKAVHERREVPAVVCVAFEALTPMWTLHRKVRRDLSAVLRARWSESSSVALIMERFTSLLTAMYMEYARSIPVSIRLLEGKELQSALGKYELSSLDDTLFHILGRPLEILNQTNRIIVQMMEATPCEHADYKSLVQASADFQRQVSALYKCREEAERCDILEQLELKMTATRQELLPLNLVSKDRYIVRQGKLKRQTRRGTSKFHFHLFNDLLLYSNKVLTTGKWNLHHKIWLKDVQVSTGQASKPLAIEIKAPQKSFVILAENRTQFKDWSKDIERQVRESKEQAKLRGEVVESVVSHAPIWVQDHQNDSCGLCSNQFTFLNRRHHCRNCGILCCGKCSATKLTLPNISATKKVRVCDPCTKKLSRSKSLLGL